MKGQGLSQLPVLLGSATKPCPTEPPGNAPGRRYGLGRPQAEALKNYTYSAGAAPNLHPSRMSSGVVVKLHAPTPLTLVLGVPPLLEDAGLTARKDYKPTEICLGRPPILQGDLPVLAHEE